jgi:dual specificity MAP kinase phosphatase
VVQFDRLKRGFNVPNRPIRNSAFRLRSRLFGHARNYRRRRNPELPPNVDVVTPQLILGGFIDREDWRKLVEQDVSVVVSLQAERHDEDAFGTLQPDGYLRLPTTDFSPPTIAQLRMGAAFIDEAVRAGKIVLVHCHAGVGRSAMQCASYLIYTGMQIDEAWDLLKSKRPQVFLNERQRASLQAFATEIAAERTARSLPVEGPEIEPRLAPTAGNS